MVVDFSPSERDLHLSKPQAAARQVEAAIAALRVGDYDIAITLAGAAEDMLVGDPDVEITSKLFEGDLPAEVSVHFSKGDIYNFERNWLKHKTATAKMPDEITLTVDNCAMYVYRAIRKLPLECITNSMLAMEHWYRARISQQRAEN